MKKLNAGVIRRDLTMAILQDEKQFSIEITTHVNVVAKRTVD